MQERPRRRVNVNADLNHGSEALRHFEGDGEETRVKRVRSTLHPGEQRAGNPAPKPAGTAKAYGGESKETARDDVARVMDAEVNPRDGENARYVKEQQDPGSARDTQQSCRERKPQGAVIAGKGVPAQQPLRVHAIGQYCRDDSGSQNGARGTHNSKDEIFAVPHLIFTLSKSFL